MRSIKTILLLLSLTLFLPAMAQDDVNASAQMLCAKIQSCGLQQLDQKGMSAQTKLQVKQSLQTLCDAMLASYQSVLKKRGVEKQAKQCINSMLAQSCDQLMDENQAETQQCAAMR